MMSASTPGRRAAEKRKRLRMSVCLSAADSSWSPAKAMISSASNDRRAFRSSCISELEVDEAITGKRAERQQHPDAPGDERQPEDRPPQERSNGRRPERRCFDEHQRASDN